MQSYDSDDYDDATYIQLQSKRVLPQQQAPRMLFETSADRRKLKTSRVRKVSTVVGPDVHKLNLQPPLLHSRRKVKTSRMIWLIRLQKELEAEIAEINPAVALLLFIWRRCSPACTTPAAAIMLDRFIAPCCLASHS